MKEFAVAVAMALLASCVEPPRVYHVDDDDAPVDVADGGRSRTTPRTTCACDGATKILYQPIEYYDVEPGVDTVIVVLGSESDGATVVLPPPAQNDGRSITVKALSAGHVLIHPSTESSSSLIDMSPYIDMDASAFPFPSRTFRAFTILGKGGKIARAGWAVIAVTP